MVSTLLISPTLKNDQIFEISSKKCSGQTTSAPNLNFLKSEFSKQNANYSRKWRYSLMNDYIQHINNYDRNIYLCYVSNTCADIKEYAINFTLIFSFKFLARLCICFRSINVLNQWSLFYTKRWIKCRNLRFLRD